MSVVVVDTNVVLVANRQHSDVSEPCIADCALRLQALMKGGKLALDEGFEILREYQNKTTPKSGNRPGDAFVKWALQNRANPKHVDIVAIEFDQTRGFVSFPNDPRLGNFDPPDRKFVAVANAHAGRPPILQATDSKWITWEEPLKKHGVMVEFICKVEIDRFHTRKSRK